MHHTESVTKSAVLSAVVYVVSETQLMNPPQALKLLGIDDPSLNRMNFNKAVDRIPKFGRRRYAKLYHMHQPLFGFCQIVGWYPKCRSISCQDHSEYAFFICTALNRQTWAQVAVAGDRCLAATLLNAELAASPMPKPRRRPIRRVLALAQVLLA